MFLDCFTSHRRGKTDKSIFGESTNTANCFFKAKHCKFCFWRLRNKVGQRFFKFFLIFCAKFMFFINYYSCTLKCIFSPREWLTTVIAICRRTIHKTKATVIAIIVRTSYFFITFKAMANCFCTTIVAKILAIISRIRLCNDVSIKTWLMNL